MYPQEDHSTAAQPDNGPRSISSETTASDSDGEQIRESTLERLVKSQEKLIDMQQEHLEAQKQTAKVLAKLTHGNAKMIRELEEINTVLRLNTLRDVSDLHTMSPVRAKKFIEVLGDLPCATDSLDDLEEEMEITIAEEVKNPRSLGDVLGDVWGEFLGPPRPVHTVA